MYTVLRFWRCVIELFDLLTITNVYPNSGMVSTRTQVLKTTNSCLRS